MVTILSISQITSDIIEVSLSIENTEYQFVFTLEKDQFEPNLISIKEESNFSKLFMFNVHISSKILQLVIKMINHQEINFPLEIGEFYTKEEALKQQKYFSNKNKDKMTVSIL